MQAAAQCAFTPTITPTNIILCPNGTDTIWTQAYDAYQWNMDGTPVPGATEQFFVVDYWQHAGASFTVTATQAGCTETSASVLVDGYVFLLPTVATYGDPHICPGDTVILELMSPYETSIQWYKDGMPITDAHDDSLIVTEAGAYTVEGAPAVCPAYIAPLGLDITITASVQPVVMPSDLKLCNGAPDTLATMPYVSHHWFHEGLPIPEATSNVLIVTEPGNYQIQVNDGLCLIYSDTVTVEDVTTGTITITMSGTDLVANTSHPDIDSFQWYLDGVAIPGATAATFHPTVSGSYTVAGMENTCTVTSESFAYELPSSIENTNPQDIVTVHPNPTTGILLIESKKALRLSVYDLTGKRLLDAAGPGRLDLSHLPGGSYLLLAADKDGLILTRKLISKQ